MRMWRMATPLFSFVLGTLYALLSGRAEGFFSSRSFVFLAIVFVQLVLVVKVIVQRKAHDIFSCFILVLSLYLGGSLDSYRIRLTQQRGNELVGLIKKFQLDKGQLPKTLNDLARLGIVVPEPALRGSLFRYHNMVNDFQLSFDSTSFRLCSRNGASSDWTCDD